MAADGTLKFDTKIDKSGFQSGVSTLGSMATTGLKTAITAITAVSTGLTAAAGAAIKVGSSFEAGMSQVSAISGATGKDLEKLTAKAKEMGAKTKFSATESAEAFNYMAMAGWKTADMIGGIDGIMNLAAASGENLASVSDIVTDALTAFGLKASDSAHFADVLATASSNSNTNVGLMGATFKYVAPIAGSMGYSIEDAATAIGLMANAGIKGEQAGTSLRAMLTRLVKPTKESAGAMEALGIEMTNADGTMKPLREVVGDLRAAFADLSESERAEYAANLAGQEAMSGLLAIVTASEDDFNKLTAAIDNADGSAKTMADTMQNNLKGKITILKSSLEGLGIQFYEGLQEPLKEAVQTGIDYIGRLSKAFTSGGLSAAVEEAGGIFADLATRVAQSAPKMINAAVRFIQSFVQGIQKNSGKLLKAASDIVKSLVNGLVKLLPKEVQRPVNEAIKSITGSFNSGALKNAIKAVGDMISKLAKVVATVAKDVFPAFNAVLGFLGNNLQWIGPLVLGLVGAFEAFKIVHEVTAWMGALTAAITASGAAASAEALAHAASTGALTLKQVAVGVLTGQIGLATAAQWAWNAAMDANPIGMVVLAIGALVAGVAALAMCLEDATDEGWAQVEAAEAEAEAHREAADAAEERLRSYEEMGQARAEQANAEIAEIEYVEKLAGELMTLADENGNVTDANRVRAEFILNQLNEAMGTEYQLVDGQIQGYKDLTSTIYDEIEAKKAKILLDAMEPEYIEAVKNAKLAQQEVVQDDIDLSEKRNALSEHEMELEETLDKLYEETSKNEVERNTVEQEKLREKANQLQATVAAEKSSIESLERKRETDRQFVDKYYKNISDYEKAWALIHEGKTQEAIKVLESKNLAIIHAEDVAGKSKDEQIRILGEQYDAYVKNAEQMRDKYRFDADEKSRMQMEDAQALADQALEEFQKVGGNFSTGMATGVDDHADELSGSTTSALNSAKRDGATVDFSPLGTNIDIGIASAIRRNGSFITSALTSELNNAVAAGKRAIKSNSPSKLTRDVIGKPMGQGVAVGVEETTDDVTNAVEKQTDAARAAYQVNADALVQRMRAAVSSSAGRVASAVSAQANYNISVSGQAQAAQSGPVRTAPQAIENHIIIDGREFAIVTTPYIEEEMGYR